MTLEQLMMYLWHDMPVTGLIAILALVSMLGGLAIYLEGKSVMRDDSFAATSTSARADGSMVTFTSYSVGNDYNYGRRTSQRGLAIIAFSLVALISLVYL